MAAEVFRYDRMVEDALRGVVRLTLEIVAERGLTGNHHIYLTFDTTDPGVDIADHLRAKYPREMTVVIQHKFWGLEIVDDVISVTLSFNRVNERLRIPLRAVTGFADPSVNFGLQFSAGSPAAAGAALEPAPAADEQKDVAPETAPADKGDALERVGADDDGTGDDEDNVVALDAFRKK